MNRYIPNQHGAWAMLIVPFLFGLSAGSIGWMQLLLFIGWLLIYLFSFPLLQWIKTGKAARYKQPVLVYGACLLPVVCALVWYRPALLLYGAALIPFFLIPAYYAKTKNERALLNDMVAVLLFSSFVYPVVYLGGGESWRHAHELFAVSAVYFAGTVFYVKTVIREKNNPRFYAASLIYHVAAIVAMGLLEPMLMLPFGILFVRAALLPKRGIKAKQSGIAEIGFSAMLVMMTLLLVF